MEADLRRIRSWRHEVGPTERREEVMERCLVRDVDDAQLQAIAVG